ncbi:MAG: hypothetical protein Q8P52_00235 [bacterium]|nr:hypothetical protein [bacterium]
MNAKHLGELVQQDRVRLGWTQEQLTSKLQGAQNKPVDPYTKKPKKFNRTWITKLESASLSRELSLELRHLLADVLDGDKGIYESLSTKEESHRNSSTQGECSNIQRIGVMVRTARIGKGWSQRKANAELNKLLKEDFTTQSFSNLENGRVKRELSLERRQALCQVLGIDPAEMDKLANEPRAVKILDKLKKQDVLPLLKKIARMEGFESLNFEQLTALCEAYFSLKEVGVEFSTILAT